TGSEQSYVIATHAEYGPRYGSLRARPIGALRSAVSRRMHDSPCQNARHTVSERTTHGGELHDSPQRIAQLTVAERTTHRGSTHDSPGWIGRLTVARCTTHRRGWAGYRRRAVA